MSSFNFIDVVGYIRSILVTSVILSTTHRKLREAIIKKNGESWEFVPTGGREVYPDPNLLTGFLKCPETYNKHIFFSILRGGKV